MCKTLKKNQGQNERKLLNAKYFVKEAHKNYLNHEDCAYKDKFPPEKSKNSFGIWGPMSKAICLEEEEAVRGNLVMITW